MNAIGYVFVGVFLAISALLCCYTTIMSQTYDTSMYFYFLIFSFIVLIPLLTMKLFAEEKKLRTEQLLMTAPVSIWGMILGKFFAAFTLFAGSVIVSCINFYPLFAYASADQVNSAYGTPGGPIFAIIAACIIGILFIGAAFIALGLFISSLTENQLAAAIITVAIILGMLLLNIVNGYLTEAPVLRAILNTVCFMSRFAPFQSGLLDPSSLIYYLSFAGVFLLLTVRVYDKRRWA